MNPVEMRLLIHGCRAALIHMPRKLIHKLAERRKQELAVWLDAYQENKPIPIPRFARKYRWPYVPGAIAAERRWIWRIWWRDFPVYSRTMYVRLRWNGDVARS